MLRSLLIVIVILYEKLMQATELISKLTAPTLSQEFY